MNNNISFNIIDLVKDSYGAYINNTFIVFQSIKLISCQIVGKKFLNFNNYAFS